jgi:deoxycytidylate deaminase
VGSCIVNGDGQVVGVGYNGFVKGIDDDDKTIPWAAGKDKHPARRKLPYGKGLTHNILFMIH